MENWTELSASDFHLASSETNFESSKTSLLSKCSIHNCYFPPYPLPSLPFPPPFSCPICLFFLNFPPCSFSSSFPLCRLISLSSPPPPPVDLSVGLSVSLSIRFSLRCTQGC